MKKVVDTLIIKSSFKSMLVIFVCVMLYPIKISIGGGDFSISYFALLILAFAFLFQYKLTFNKKVAIALVFFVFYILFQSLFFGLHVDSIIQFLLIAVSVFSGLYIIKKVNIYEFYSAYYKVVFALCVFSLIQAVSYLIGIEFVYDLSWLYSDYEFRISEQGMPRFHSILPEPAHFIQVISPVVFILFFSSDNNYLKSSKLSKALVLLACLISMSSMFVILVLTSVFLKLYIDGVLSHGGFHKNLVLTSICLVFLFLSYNYVESFNSRLSPFVSLFSESGFTLDDTLNFSSFTLLNNLYVAIESFEKTYFLGLGLGTHELSYSMYSATNYIDNIPELNKKDANSLFIRGVSELGVFSILFFVALFYSFIRLNKFDLLCKTPVFVFIFIYILRVGNYSAYGFWIFLMYFFVARCGDDFKKV